MGVRVRLQTKIPALMIFAIINLTSCSTVRVEPTKPVEKNSAPPVAAEPARKQISAPVGRTISHKAYTVVYDDARRMAIYVRYSLTAEHLRASFVKRKEVEKFKSDPDLIAMGVPAAKPAEYLRSGYDKGHLAPFADFAWDKEASLESFYMSNMVPQKPKLNRVAWEKLEEQVRRWACGEKQVTVYTGPVKGPEDTELPSGLPVPERFFKVVVDDTPPRKAIAFIYNQKDSVDVMVKRRVSVVEVTALTGVDFPGESRLDSTLRAPTAVEDWAEDDCSRGR